ncbi:hypothetical protein JT689_10820 [Halobacterium sp. GSL-19]|uniref:hypothetical protein n=1 Tax=Halobacterium sp. GSL-19 TaxID=2812551 RepID=UPI0019632B4E|nr:hypothetical protein [Halobacterium sp. GSL-19]QRY22492.1 hypothetical protein JT689_10820 [Halobacterium sp. GSL-19]
MVDSLHQPEYTGENRCEPCTVVNLVIAAVISSLIARKSRIFGLIAVLISVGLIYLRGYLIPGTPTLTKQYLPPTVLRWFGKEPTEPTRGGLGTGNSAVESPSHRENSSDRSIAQQSPTDDGRNLEQYLIDKNILKICDGGSDLCLTTSFKSDLDTILDELDKEEVTTENVTTAFQFDGNNEFLTEEYDDAVLLRRGTTIVGQWPSKAALLADVAISKILADRDSDWKDFNPEAQGEILNGVRIFLDRCPICRSDIQFTEETVESCCQSHEVIAAVCEDTSKRLFEQPIN